VASPDDIATANRLIDILEKTNIDISTLKMSDGVSKLNFFETRELPQEIRSRFKALRNIWKASVWTCECTST
jgi:hypothetical protein